MTGNAKSQANAIHDSITQMDGIKAVRIDSFANTVTVDYDDSRISSSDIQSKLRQHNYI
ncbi:heavy-metal-associated domain-containing protein [Thermotalea metallivorans]|uniref:heavy-metal-associated domain-containing protein n=1 Tax=Thermotalea metallivorans TaxID=520762 RepID=UPI0009FAC082